jgi:hypothetical protein
VRHRDVRWFIHLCTLAAAGLVLSVATLQVTAKVAAPSPRSQPSSVKDVAGEAEVRARCAGVCHAFPQPDILPRASWRDELVRMMLISEGIPEPAGATGFIALPPDWMRLLRYYESRAPERLPDPEPWPAAGDDSRLRLTRMPLSGPAPGVASAMANVRFVHLDADKRLDLVASDMRTGIIYRGLAAASHKLEPLAKLSHPSHVEPVDIDRDGRLDLLVTDLGSYQPADHNDGAVYVLRRTSAGGFDTVRVAWGLPRVADARAADFDRDGDLDLIVASFGWRQTGNITLLENRTTDWLKPVFASHLLDQRTGAIHVPTADLDGDKFPDFIALLAQQHESIVAYVNTGKDFAFTQQLIYAAPHPNWGSSGIELVDLDGDGDQDVLYTHGDTFDDFVVKPYHGIQWLENTGRYPYVEHSLAGLPGAQRAQAADMDGDGDLDVVAAAMISGGEMNARLASIVWLEQVSKGTFQRRTIEMGTPFHATLDLADANGDGRPDILVGWFAFDRPLDAWADLWLNGGTK